MFRTPLSICVLVLSASLAAGSAFADDPHAPAHDMATTPHGAAETAATEQTAANTAHEEAPGQSSHGGPAAHWGYDGNGGPAHWGDLNEDYATCKTGERQSPIDMAAAKEGHVAPIAFDYKNSPLHMVNNGHTIQVDMPPGSSMTVDGKSYQLLQFHFHTPSEHVVLGKHYPMEMHLVHKADDGTLAVIGVFVEPGDANDTLKRIWRRLPARAGETVEDAHVVFNPRDLLPKHRSYARYLGSLTTPPCSEGVRWHVMMSPVQVDEHRIKAASGIMGQNARPAQTIGFRDVVRN